MAAAQFVDVPGYSALLVRRTFPDLNKPGGLIPRSKEWWSGKASWNAQQKEWTFPSGAKVSFGYLERDDDVYQYQGAEFQFVGIDELTQHTSFRYRYLFSRIRRPREGPLSQVPLRMRAGTNPGGKGHDWVKARWGLRGKLGASPCPGRAFIPAKLEDNPSLDQEEYVRSLAHLDPLTLAQLLDGDWDAIADGRFQASWLRHYTRHGTGFNLAGRIYTVDEVRHRFLTVDPAATVQQTAGDDPDWTVISAWGIAERNLLWLGCKRLRVEIPDIAPRVAEEYLVHRADKALIEGFGIGRGPAQLAARHPLSSRPGHYMNVLETTPKGRDKLTRAADALNLAQAGRLWLPGPGIDPAFPLEEVEAELLRFTGDEKRDAHDDVVDTLSEAAIELRGKDDERADGQIPYVIRNDQ